MCSFIALMHSVRIYNVNTRKNTESTLNEKVCPSFWPILEVLKEKIRFLWESLIKQYNICIITRLNEGENVAKL